MDSVKVSLITMFIDQESTYHLHIHAVSLAPYTEHAENQHPNSLIVCL